MSKLDDFTAMLKARADQNADGKLDKRDVETLAARVRAQVEVETKERPWGVIAAAAIVAGVIGFVIGFLVG